jgi:hypothetical protein
MNRQQPLYSAGHPDKLPGRNEHFCLLILKSIGCYPGSNTYKPDYESFF